MQSNSNTQLNQNLFRVILSTVFILTAVLFTNPITAYANYNQNGSDGSGDAGEDGKLYMNGVAENGTTASLSYLYWAGDTSRSGYIMYIVDTSTDKILSL